MRGTVSDIPQDEAYLEPTTKSRRIAPAAFPFVSNRSGVGYSQTLLIAAALHAL